MDFTDLAPRKTEKTNKYEDEPECSTPYTRKSFRQILRDRRFNDKLEKARKGPPKKKHYFTAAANVDSSTARDFNSEKSPFIAPEDLEVFAHKVMTKAWRNEAKIREMNKKCANKLSYYSRQRGDLLNRLYVEDPGIGSMKTHLDYDLDYYKIIEGRPVPEQLNLKEYTKTLRDILRTRIIIGYRDDDVMLIDEKLILEQKLINQINDQYQEYVNAFEEFLSRDHTESMNLISESEKSMLLTNEKYAEYRQLAKDYAALRSSVYKTEESWHHCQSYQTFLRVISPMSWRKEHPLDESVHDVCGKYGKCRLSTMKEVGSLEDLTKVFQKALESTDPPEMYFEHPDQLMEVFQFLEMQNLNALLHTEEFAGPLNMVKETTTRAEEEYDAEIQSMQDEINKLEGGISWEEKRAMFLDEVITKLIHEDFKKLVTAESCINLFVLVEDVYETRIGPNDANLSMVEMMKAIEQKYRDELLQLDKMPVDQVTALEGNYYKEEMRVMKLAEAAAKQYVHLERVMRNINTSMEPPFVKSYRELKQRSPPSNPPKYTGAPPRQLTEKEAEYLNFFTEYCQYRDSPTDFGIDVTPHAPVDKQRQEAEDKKHSVAQKN